MHEMDFVYIYIVLIQVKFWKCPCFMRDYAEIFTELPTFFDRAKWGIIFELKISNLQPMH